LLKSEFEVIKSTYPQSAALNKKPQVADFFDKKDEYEINVSQLIEDEYDVIETPSEIDVIELHNNHTFKQNETLTEKITSGFTNLGYIISANGSRTV